MLLVKLLVSQVVDNWDTIWYAIRTTEIQEANASDEKEIENVVLESIVKGELEVYYAIRRGELIGILALKEDYEYITMTKNLLIFSLFGVRAITMENWILGITALRKIAKAKMCSNIVAQTSNKKIIEVTKALGGDASWTLIKLEV